MKRRNGVTIAAVLLLLSAAALASSIADPGGIIRSGSDYTGYAIIEPGLFLTFDGEPVTSFDPFHAGFCFGTDGGQECDFENQSGQTISALSQIFVHPPSDFTGANTLSCTNEISPESCNTGSGNELNFFNLGIHSTAVEEWSAVLLDSTNTDPDFNILYFGFTDNGLARIAGTTFVPEPASLGLMLSGLFGLGLVWKRRARATNR